MDIVSLPPNKKKNKKNIILIIIISLIVIFCLSYLIWYLIDQYKIKKIRQLVYENTVSYCSNLFENNIIKKNTEIIEIDNCLEKIDLIYDQNQVKQLKQDTIEAKKYIKLKESINSFYNNQILTSTITQEDIDNLLNTNNELSDIYKSSTTEKINNIKNDYDSMLIVIESVNNLFSSSDKSSVRSDVSKDDYNKASNLVNELKQEDLKNELNTYLNQVISYIDKRANEEKQKIKNAWIKLNVPYTSQNKLGVHNGCEAASLLMALQYKGYLKDMDLITYSENMPKSDDPNTGFYLSIFSDEPKDVAHWIAPQPLVEFGIKSSGYNNIINSTGSNIEQLAQEVLNGNPVIIYLTFDYLDPYNWNNGVPKNLHVQLLTGYNTITEEYFITDPWYHNSGKYQFTLSKSRIKYLYDTIGKKSVIIR